MRPGMLLWHCMVRVSAPLSTNGDDRYWWTISLSHTTTDNKSKTTRCIINKPAFCKQICARTHALEMFQFELVLRYNWQQHYWEILFTLNVRYTFPSQSNWWANNSLMLSHFLSLSHLLSDMHTLSLSRSVDVWPRWQVKQTQGQSML